MIVLHCPYCGEAPGRFEPFPGVVAIACDPCADLDQPVGTGTWGPRNERIARAVEH